MKNRWTCIGPSLHSIPIGITMYRVSALLETPGILENVFPGYPNSWKLLEFNKFSWKLLEFCIRSRDSWELSLNFNFKKICVIVFVPLFKLFSFQYFISSQILIIFCLFTSEEYQHAVNVAHGKNWSLSYFISSHISTNRKGLCTTERICTSCQIMKLTSYFL